MSSVADRKLLFVMLLYGVAHARGTRIYNMLFFSVLTWTDEKSGSVNARLLG